MRKLILPLFLVLLLVSCRQPEPEPVEIQPYVTVYHAVKNGTIWVQMWIEGKEVPDGFSMLPSNGNIRIEADINDICHIRIRVIEEVTAIEDGDHMKRIEKIADSKDYDFEIENRATTITVYRSADGYIYAFRVFE